MIIYDSLSLSRLNRASGHKLVEEACRRAQFERRHLREILSADTEVTAILGPQSIAQLFEPADYLGSAEAFIETVLSAANSQSRSTIKSNAMG